MGTGKLVGLMVLASISAIGPSLADSSYDQFGSQNDVPVNAWADLQPTAPQTPYYVAQRQTPGTSRSAAYQPSAPAPKRLEPKTSKRTNTNLSLTLPWTATPSNETDLNVVDDGSVEPKVDEAGIIDNAYDTATLIRESIEAARDKNEPFSMQ